MFLELIVTTLVIIFVLCICGQGIYTLTKKKK